MFRIDTCTITGYREFSGDANPYTPNGTTISITIDEQSEPLIRALLDLHRERLLATMADPVPLAFL